MNKPTIFFSHSARDKKSLTFIRNQILKKSSNTINIFQSSDGESIPFGNNWVHKIEENLKDSRLMFVFVTPNSIKSNWLYFESGFSYSKGVKVIPIGLNGIDIGKIGPPINLLQGFNITSHEGLNNLLTVINKEFDTSYELNFTHEDFIKLNELSNYLINDRLQNTNIDYFFTRFGEIQSVTFNAKSFEIIADYLKEKNIKHSLGKNKIHLNGMEIVGTRDSFFGELARPRPNSTSNLDLKIDELYLKESLQIINELVTQIYSPPLTTFWIFIKFNENVELLSTNFKLSSRLSLIGIEMSEEKGTLYNFKTLRFGLSKNTGKIENVIKIVYSLDKFDYNDILELIEILFDNYILKIR